MLEAVGASKDDFDPTLVGQGRRRICRAHVGEDELAAAYEDGRRSEARRLRITPKRTVTSPLVHRIATAGDDAPAMDVRHRKDTSQPGDRRRAGAFVRALESGEPSGVGLLAPDARLLRRRGAVPWPATIERFGWPAGPGSRRSGRTAASSSGGTASPRAQGVVSGHERRRRDQGSSIVAASGA